MNSGNVLQMTPKVDPGQGNAQLILGLLPCQNQFLLNAVAPVILPGIKELAAASLGEFTAYQVMNDILYGAKQLHLGYADRTGIKPEQFQETFAKKLMEPAKDFVGFSVIEPLRNAGFHIFAVYIMPEFRGSNMMKNGLEYLEAEAKKMGSPYISLSTAHGNGIAFSALGYVETYSNYRKQLSKE
jgi:ribosomal protein S18 acetylase RimI-like enzyme